MENYLIWLAAGFTLVIAELVTGTFYLLMLGLAAFTGSAAAWFGLNFWLQALIAAVAAVAGVVWVQRFRKSAVHPDMASLDVGQSVTLDAWVSRDEGAARVKYRGTLWDAHVEGERAFEHGQVLYIHAIDGNTLKVGISRP
jgi:membrane protein implicated in regulation of membrane protease activity